MQIDPEVSIVIPLKDEALNVDELHDELTGVMAQIGVPYELILVDDGSTDGTFARLERIQAADPLVRVIRFTRNFGQTAAFAAGFAHARGRYIITSDGDLQNDPADIPRMLTLAHRKDMVCGWRRNRQDALLTRHLPSVVANWLISLVSGVKLHDNGCSLKVFRAEVVKPLRLRPGMHRYLPALASQLGGRVAEVSVNHRPRRFGQSKYGLSRTFTVVRDLFELRRLMRDASDPSTPMPVIYAIAEIRETDHRDAGTPGYS
ncbi:MAG: glycosyltransferase family 2 protein [Vicinamibacterales bacterium]